MTLLLSIVEYYVVLVNYMLKRWIFSAFVVVWDLLHLIELLCVCVGFLLCSAVILFQCLCVLLQWFLVVFEIFLPELLFMFLYHVV